MAIFARLIETSARVKLNTSKSKAVGSDVRKSPEPRSEEHETVSVNHFDAGRAADDLVGVD